MESVSRALAQQLSLCLENKVRCTLCRLCSGHALACNNVPLPLYLFSPDVLVLYNSVLTCYTRGPWLSDSFSNRALLISTVLHPK